ncbi:MAG: hypothetical protein HGA96_01745 [Desulfobulbaceae bacterium]|nr:hypothetical protein [Desulfobulbaceae bacterium]
MKKFNWQTLLIGGLLAVSGAVYALQIVVFHNPRDTFFYLFQDLAFVPLQVLLVTLVLNKLLADRERNVMLKKLNMAIGLFFSEVGTSLLKSFTEFDEKFPSIEDGFNGSGDFTGDAFEALARRIATYECKIEGRGADFTNLRAFLLEQRGFLLTLLENPNLLEHESFTELLWAVFHLTEELARRENSQVLGEKDADHIAGDLKRAYVLLLAAWLSYMQHLRDEYPYLFSFAMRTNPFNPAAAPEIR